MINTFKNYQNELCKNAGQDILFKREKFFQFYDFEKKDDRYDLYLPVFFLFFITGQ